jgi:iron(III) transport system ATP-binding protein
MTRNSALTLQLQSVSKTYGNPPVPAVDRVSCDLPTGEILGLLGPSGCGKTSLLRLIAGFDRPEAGQIWLGDRLVADGGVWVPPEARGIGMVFQDFALFPHLTVGGNIAFGLRADRQPAPAQLRQRVAEVLELVGLAGLGQRFPHELSGGQQQRVALARALAPQPALVLLDEPLSNLDVQVRLHLRQELRIILKAAQTAAIFVTHDQEEALSICDRVAVMRSGVLEQLDRPEVIYQNPASRFVAEFVTQANFLPADCLGDCWATPVGLLPAASKHQRGDRGWLMVRQEALQLQSHGEGAARIIDRQFLGRHYRYTLLCQEELPYYALTEVDTALAVGERVQVVVAPQNLRWFPWA